MNRTNGGNRSSRIFVGILLIALACLIVLYYHEHRSAKNAEALSVTLEQQTRAIDESLEKFLALKETCRNEREQLTKANEDQETKINTALQQAQDWQQRYERVMNDKVCVCTMHLHIIMCVPEHVTVLCMNKVEWQPARLSSRTPETF